MSFEICGKTTSLGLAIEIIKTNFQSEDVEYNYKMRIYLTDWVGLLGEDNNKRFQKGVPKVLIENMTSKNSYRILYIRFGAQIRVR